MNKIGRLLFVSLVLSVLAACSQDQAAVPGKPADLGAPSSTTTGKVAITNGVPISNLSGASSSQRYDSIAVPSGARNLTISISGGTGDADLYVRFGSQPTTSAYNCRPYKTGNSETCTFSTPQVGTYYIMIRGYTAYSGVTLSASYTSGTTNPTPTGAFDIQFVYGSSITSAQRTLFENAALRWESVITGDLANATVNKASNLCGANEPAYSGTVDDLVIFAEVGPLDGAGNTLAQAGPCLVRSGGVTSYGIMQFDSADVASFDLNAIIQHEMGHVLGIGTLWTRFSLVNYTSTSCPTTPRYTGASARSEWNALGGTGDIPVEDGGGSGTRCGHWDEGTFNSELMTGYIETSGSMPLSRMTAGTLEDMRYVVNKAVADAYSLPTCSPTCASLAPLGVDIAAREVLLEPIGTTDENGTVRKFGSDHSFDFEHNHEH